MTKNAVKLSLLVQSSNNKRAIMIRKGSGNSETCYTVIQKMVFKEAGIYRQVQQVHTHITKRPFVYTATASFALVHTLTRLDTV